MKILIGQSILGQAAYGPLRVYRRQPFQLDFLSKRTPEEEIYRFHAAQRHAVLQLAELYDQAAALVGPKAASIFAIHAMLLEDVTFEDSILSIIQTQYATAEYAVQVAGTSFSAAFAALDNPYMAARGADLRDISNRMIRLLLGLRAPELLGSRPAILVADELLPSEAIAADRKKFLGAVVRHGSQDSHTAILMRLLHVPALVQTDLPQDCDGHPALLDGVHHRLWVDPDQKILSEMGFGPKPKARTPRVLAAP